MKIKSRQRALIIGGIVLSAIVALAWLATTQNVAVWPVRNIVHYRVLTWWWGLTADEIQPNSGSLAGAVFGARGEPVEDAWILVARRDGTTFSDRSNALGRYLITDLPPGRYRPVAGAPAHESVQLGDFFSPVEVWADKKTELDITLPAEPARTVPAGRDFFLGEPTTISCESPLEARATRRQIHFTSDNRPNQPAFYYTPVTTTTNRLPLLMAIYPGPADTWECASLPLAEAGYAVVATGPAYSFEIEADIDELVRLLDFARQEKFPGADGRRLALLGGSYSSLHVQRLLQRGEPVQAAMLLGPPTDLFDLRRRLEQGNHIQPFGLDQALIALGFPDRESLRYWRYSGAYHVRDDFPPVSILHSRSDRIVPYQQSELLADTLSQAGATFELHIFDGGSHYLLAEKDDALAIYQLAQDFLGKYLQ
jgi:dipeptidyl aminopeptidase/acylaminoacyl peptidase